MAALILRELLSIARLKGDRVLSGSGVKYRKSAALSARQIESVHSKGRKLMELPPDNRGRNFQYQYKGRFYYLFVRWTAKGRKVVSAVPVSSV